MDMFSEFALDSQRLTDGVWRVFDATTDEIVEESAIGLRPAVLLTSTDNPKYQEILEKKMKPHVMKRGTDIDRKIKERMVAETLAECVILGWKNWKIKDQDFPYSKAAVVELWTDAKWIRLKERILAMIGDTDAFKAEREADIVGNS